MLQLKRWLPQLQLISRLRLEVALYEPAPIRATGQVGHKRLKNKQLAPLAQLAGAGILAWHWLEVVDGYGGQSQRAEYATSTVVWYHSGKPPVPIRWVMVRLNGKLTGLVSNDSTLLAEQIINYFVRRWSMETTFALVRAHLGVESQRQWSTLAIARTTLILMSLFSLVTLIANSLQKQGQLSCQVSSWYIKEQITFSDALAGVRRYLGRQMIFCTSGQEAVHVKMSQQ